jgi:transposase
MWLSGSCDVEALIASASKRYLQSKLSLSVPPPCPGVLWAVVEPLLLPEPPKPKGGRPRLPDRAALTGILFVLRFGIPWEMQPQEMGCGCGMTCWRKVRDLQEAGVWDRLQRAVLDRLGRRNALDFRRAALDSASDVDTRRIVAADMAD